MENRKQTDCVLPPGGGAEAVGGSPPPGSEHSNVPISDIFKGPNYRLKTQALAGFREFVRLNPGAETDCVFLFLHQ